MLDLQEAEGPNHPCTHTHTHTPPCFSSDFSEPSRRWDQTFLELWLEGGSTNVSFPLALPNLKLGLRITHCCNLLDGSIKTLRVLRVLGSPLLDSQPTVPWGRQRVPVPACLPTSLRSGASCNLAGPPPARRLPPSLALRGAGSAYAPACSEGARVPGDRGALGSAPTNFFGTPQCPRWLRGAASLLTAAAASAPARWGRRRLDLAAEAAEAGGRVLHAPERDVPAAAAATTTAAGTAWTAAALGRAALRVLQGR